MVRLPLTFDLCVNSLFPYPEWSLKWSPCVDLLHRNSVKKTVPSYERLKYKYLSYYTFLGPGKPTDMEGSVAREICLMFGCESKGRDSSPASEEPRRGFALNQRLETSQNYGFSSTIYKVDDKKTLPSTFFASLPRDLAGTLCTGTALPFRLHSPPGMHRRHCCAGFDTGCWMLLSWNNSAETFSGTNWEGRAGVWLLNRSHLFPEKDHDYVLKQSALIWIPAPLLPHGDSSWLVSSNDYSQEIWGDLFTYSLQFVFFRGGYKMKKYWKKQPKKWPYCIRSTGNAKKRRHRSSVELMPVWTCSKHWHS